MRCLAKLVVLFLPCATFGFLCTGPSHHQGHRGAALVERAKSRDAPDDECHERHSEFTADIAAFEDSRTDPLVHIGESKLRGAGHGVFAQRDIKAGTTLTEWVGLVAAPPTTHADEMELWQGFYGDNWRDFSGRYEIGVSAPIATGATAAAFAEHHEEISRTTGAEVTLGGPVALGGAAHPSAREAFFVPSTALKREDCEVELGPTACEEDDQDYGDRGSGIGTPRKGDFVIYGKPVSHGACPREGVAQLINDHSAILPPEKRESHLASLGGARAAAQARARATQARARSLFRGGEKGSEHRLDGGDAGLGSVSQLSKAMRSYLARARKLNNVAMVRARGSARVFAVATRDLRSGEELYFSYGTAWWLTQLRRAALAQLATCSPPPRRARALGDVVRSAEFASLVHLDEERDVFGATGAMPRSYVNALTPFELDELFGDDTDNTDDWARLMLREEFASVTSCPLDDDERLFAPPASSSSNILRTNGPGQTTRREFRD